MRAFNRQITAVVDFIAEIRDSLRQSGNAHRRWPKMNAALALAVTQRHAENRHRLAGAWLVNLYVNRIDHSFRILCQKPDRKGGQLCLSCPPLRVGLLTLSCLG